LATTLTGAIRPGYRRYHSPKLEMGQVLYFAPSSIGHSRRIDATSGDLACMDGRLVLETAIVVDILTGSQ